MDADTLTRYGANDDDWPKIRIKPVGNKITMTIAVRATEPLNERSSLLWGRRLIFSRLGTEWRRQHCYLVRTDELEEALSTARSTEAN